MSEKRDALNDFMALARNTEGQRKERTRAFLEGERLEALLGLVSSGISLRDACAMADLNYSTLQKQLTDDPALRPLYEGARVRQAEAVLDEIAGIEHEVEHNGMDPKAAQVLIGSKQWRAERLNPKRYGPRSFQHIETVDQTALHIEAVRQLARERREALAHQPQGAQVLPPIEYTDAEIVPASDEGVDR